MELLLLDLELQNSRARSPSAPGGQTATGFLAAMLIGLIIGGALYFVLTAPSEQSLQWGKERLKREQEFAQKMGR